MLTRLVQQALRDIYSDQPAERLRELLALIAQVLEQPRATAILEALLRYYVQGTARLDEQTTRELVRTLPNGEQLMQTFLDHYFEQGVQQGMQQGEALVLIRQLERKFGAIPGGMRRRIEAADSDALLRWLDRLLSAETIDEVFD